MRTIHGEKEMRVGAGGQTKRRNDGKVGMVGGIKYTLFLVGMLYPAIHPCIYGWHWILFLIRNGGW
jgi:hypothetical protein